MATLLSQGSSGPDVRQAQQKLNLAGTSALPKLVEDSVFGAKTRVRVIEFQKSRGLKADGIIGPQTRSALGMSATVPAGPVAPGAPPGATNSAQLVTAVVNATRGAFNLWKTQASFAHISINGALATGGPGCLSGPGLFPLITAQLVGVAPADSPTAMAAAKGIATKFQQWQAGIMVPGLPWYPSFDRVPAPFAPTTPNLPTPVSMLPSPFLSGMVDPSLLQAAMSAAAQGTSAQSFKEIASRVVVLFQTSILSAMVIKVMGSGPVPIFAPPFVPTGPVTNGTASSGPGAVA